MGKILVPGNSKLLNFRNPVGGGNKLNLQNPIAKRVAYYTQLNELQKSTYVGTKFQPSPAFVSARGFGSTLGAGTTDSVETKYKTTVGTRSYVIRLKVNGAGGGGFGRVFEKRVSGAQTEVLLCASSGAELQYSRTNNYGTCYAYVTPASLLGKELIVSIVNDNAYSIPRIYINGVYQTPTASLAAGASDATVTDNGDPYVIGNRKNDSARAFDGTISDFVVLNYALTPGEIWSLFADFDQLFYDRSALPFIIPSAGGGGATITPTGLSSSAFGSFSVNAGDRILTFTGKASDEAFGAFNLRARNLVSFTGKTSDGAFGSFNVYPGKVIILPNSKTTDSTFGTHSLLSGQKLINPTAKSSDETFGSFIIISGDRILLMNGMASNEAFGAFSVNNNTANQTILTSGYFDSAFGSFSLRPDQYIIFEGKEYLEFGQFLLSGSAVVRAKHFFDWVSQQPGLRGSMNDKLYQYLRDHGFTGSTPTMLFLWLRSLGYVGNTATMLTAFERDYTTRWH